MAYSDTLWQEAKKKCKEHAESKFEKYRINQDKLFQSDLYKAPSGRSPAGALYRKIEGVGICYRRRVE